jgi:hypothetical protein
MSDDQMYNLDRDSGARKYEVQDHPVWLLRFGAVEIPAFAPGSTIAPQEGLNMVFDAMTGAYLFAYS